MNRPLRTTSLLLLAWLAASGLGPCELFKPETPESPSGDAILGNYTQPDSTLAAIVYGIRAKGQSGGDGVYLAAFADSSGPGGSPDGRGYNAFFDPVTVTRHTSQGGTLPSTWPVWGRLQEEQFFARVVRLYTEPYDMTWEEDQSQGNDEIGPGTAFIHRRYRLYRRLSNGVAAPFASGYADIRLINPGTRWVIVSWQDREDPNPPAGAICYGRLRLENQ